MKSTKVCSVYPTTLQASAVACIKRNYQILNEQSLQQPLIGWVWLNASD